MYAAAEYDGYEDTRIGDTDNAGSAVLGAEQMRHVEMASEGRVHSCEGVLCRRTTKAKMKRWKRRWFTVAPGEFQTTRNYGCGQKSPDNNFEL